MKKLKNKLGKILNKIKKRDIKKENKNKSKNNKKEKTTIQEIEELSRILAVLLMIVIVLVIVNLTQTNYNKSINKDEVIQKVIDAENEFKRLEEYEIQVTTNELFQKEIFRIKKNKETKFLVNDYLQNVDIFGELKSATTLVINNNNKTVKKEIPELRYLDKFNFNPFKIGSNISKEDIKVTLEYANGLVLGYKLSGKIDGIEHEFFVDKDTFLPILKVEKTQNSEKQFLIKYIKREIQSDEIKTPNLLGYEYENNIIE